MPSSNLEIVVQPGKVTVVYDQISKSPHQRFYAALGILASCWLLLCLALFLPGKHQDPSMWQDMRSNPVTSSGFLMPLCFLLSFLVIMAWLLARSLSIAYPGFQKLECDGNMLTVSRLRWTDFQNKQRIEDIYPMADISRVRFGVILSGRGSSIHGLRFNAAGRNYRLFPKLTTNQAGTILSGLEALGVDTERRRRAAALKEKKRST